LASSTFILILLVVVIIGSGIVFRKTKGKQGEKQVATRLARLPRDRFKILNDLILQSGGYSTQIDHVVVSIYGIFVIETKYYQGDIYGGENSEYWTQNIYGHKYQLRNPLWQNQAHIKAIRKAIGDTGKIPIYNIVAFSAQASLHVSSSLPVLYWQSVVPYIKRYDQQVISESKAEEIYSTLSKANVTDKKLRKGHLKSVQQSKQKRDAAVANGKCPRCGGTLVLRESRYGRFYGCSNYPRCNYILK